MGVLTIWTINSDFTPPSQIKTVLCRLYVVCAINRNLLSFLNHCHNLFRIKKCCSFCICGLYCIWIYIYIFCHFNIWFHDVYRNATRVLRSGVLRSHHVWWMILCKWGVYGVCDHTHIPKHLWPSWWHVIVFLYVGLRGFGIIYCEHSAKRKKDIIYVYNITLESHHNRAIQCIFACGFSFWFDEFAVMFIIIALLCVVLFTPEIKEKEKKKRHTTNWLFEFRTVRILIL